MEDAETRAARYRRKAEEVRALAASMRDLDCKAMLCDVARHYLGLAEIWEREAADRRAPVD